MALRLHSSRCCSIVGVIAVVRATAAARRNAKLSDRNELVFLARPTARVVAVGDAAAQLSCLLQLCDTAV